MNLCSHFALYLTTVWFYASQLAGCDTTYRAAVYQHRVAPLEDTDTRPFDYMLKNLKIFEEQTVVASKQGAKIIVFPEYGIIHPSLSNIREAIKPYLQQVPDPKTVTWNPCNDPSTYPNNTEVLVYLSCMAKNNSIVVVANVGDVQPCAPSPNVSCPADNVFQYNTNVAFSADGTLVARYHKQHLFEEPAMDSPSIPEHVTFETDFGIFGLIICFDALFKEPLITLVKQYGVKNIIFPHMWYDTLPFAVSIQIHELTAMGLGINLLASNAYRPNGGQLGSGIYSANRGALNYTYDVASGPKLVIADVPVNPNDAETTLYPSEEIQSRLEPSSNQTIFRTNLDNFTMIQLDSTSGEQAICNNDVCCQTTYRVDGAQAHQNYYLTAFSGLVYSELNWQICAILYCEISEDGNRTCAPAPSHPETTFSKLELWGNFTTPYVYPNVLDSDLQLVPASSWNFNRETVETNEITAVGTIHRAGIISKERLQNVLVAHVAGRVYDFN